MTDQTANAHVDVLIVGAGLSGIGAAAHLRRDAPQKSFTLLEAREDLGGTWNLFKYPGVRSDSDMFTLGYDFKPWTDDRALADGPSILEYVRETAQEYDVTKHIRFGHKVVGAHWSSEDAQWTVQAERTDTGETTDFTCSFLYLNSGYYHYDHGYTPDIEGLDRFEGPVIHPQQWPEDLDYAGKKVAVIGSGATAITLLPAMATETEHITMIQRSPTYVIALPAIDKLSVLLRKRLSAKRAYFLLRWKNVLVQMLSFQLSRRRPQVMKWFIRKNAVEKLPDGYDVDTHFKPRYDPWDERLCVVPSGDLFRALTKGTASITTGTIKTVSEHGVTMDSGEEVEADILITATGLRLLGLAGMPFTVDGHQVEVPSKLAYKSMMLEDVPNFAFTVGYTNASWTLKADLVADYVCRLLNHMDAEGYDIAKPVNHDPSVTPEPFINLNSGYIKRSENELPKAGSKAPWKLDMNYAKDIVAIRHKKLDDGVLQFSRASQHRPGATESSITA